MQTSPHACVCVCAAGGPDQREREGAGRERGDDGGVQWSLPTATSLPGTNVHTAHSIGYRSVLSIFILFFVYDESKVAGCQNEYLSDSLI